MPIPKVLKPTFSELIGLDYRTHPRYKGIVGHWIIGEGGGTQVRDISGYGRHGTFTSGDPATDWVIGQFGRTLNFDGTDDHINFGDVPWVNFGAGNWALSIWMRLASTTNNRQILLGKDLANQRQFSMDFDKANDNTRAVRFGYYTVLDGSNHAFLDTANDFINDTDWHHVLGQRVGDSFEIFLDGALNSSGTTSGTHGTMTNSTADFQIGKRTFVSFNEPFTGDLDEVRVYSRALNVAEARSLYTDPFLEFVPEEFIAKAPAAGGTFQPRQFPFRPHLTR